MNENKLKALLDNIDLENLEEFDITKEEYDLIIKRYQKELTSLKLDEFVGCITRDCYKLGLYKGLLIAGVILPRK